MTENFLIGTYTLKTSKGLYAVTLDTDQEKLTNVRLIAAQEKPAYLALGPNHLVFVLKQDGKKGGVATYQLADEHAKELDEDLSAGAPPAHVSWDKGRHMIYTANYHKGEIRAYKVSDDGHLTLTDSIVHEGQCGPRPEQDAPHAHYAQLTPDGRLAVCDLGMDLLVTYDVSDDGKLTMAARYQGEPGFGTRHLAFHPNGQYAYLLGELSSKLEVLKYNSADGSFKHLQTIKTIPDDWQAHNGAAAIHLSADGKFVYTSNRGENTIAVFAIQPDFTVKHVQSISTAGDFPRDFELSHDDRYLVASNQLSDNLTLYRRNATTGLLTAIQSGVACPEPVCVKKWY